MRRSEKKEEAGARKGRKVVIHCVFPMICGSGGSNSRLAKAAGAEPAGQMRDEKLHAGVARSTFPSQNVQSTPRSAHFWKFETLKKWTPLWREATFPSQKCQKLRGSDHLDFQMSFCVAGAKDCAPRQKWAKHDSFVAVSATTSNTVHHATLHPTALHYTTRHKLHAIILRYTTLHYIALRYAPLHYTLHYTTLKPSLQLQLQLQHNYATTTLTPLHYTRTTATTTPQPHYIALHYTPLHYATLHYTTSHYITPRYAVLNCTKLHYT